MSADNCIAVISTTSSFRRPDENSYVNLCEGTQVHYRVAHAQAIENFDWYKEKQPYNVGAYIKGVWPDWPVYTTKEAAKAAAREMEDEVGYTEYGIIWIDATEYHYMGE